MEMQESRPMVLSDIGNATVISDQTAKGTPQKTTAVIPIMKKAKSAEPIKDPVKVQNDLDELRNTVKTNKSLMQSFKTSSIRAVLSDKNLIDAKL